MYKFLYKYYESDREKILGLHLHDITTYHKLQQKNELARGRLARSKNIHNNYRFFETE